MEGARRVGVPVEPVAGGGDRDETDRIFDEMARVPEQSFADFIAKADAPEQVKRAATGFVECFSAAYKERVSVAWLNRENAASDEIEGDRFFRVRSGYDSVPAFLARNLDIRLNTPVRRLAWIAVLYNGGLTIDPEPEKILRARDASGAGRAIRVTFRFRDPIPETGFLRGDQPFPVWWTGGPVVTAWAAGPKADALRGCDAEQLKQIALLSLREPVEDTLYFAGEAVAPSAHLGTVHGALVSGIHAAATLAAVRAVA